MIKKENFENLLISLEFSKNANIFIKKGNNYEMSVDFDKEELIYPKDLKVNDKTTSNFSSDENFVVFECVLRLLEQGYSPKHIELEKKWQLGHTQKSGRADICVKDNNDNIILIIECKTAGKEYNHAIKILENDARNQLFSYLQQANSTKFLALYTSDFIDNKTRCKYYLINVQDNEELLKNNKKLKSFKDANTAEEKWAVWCDTYDKEYANLGLFENSKPYEIGKDKFTFDDLQEISSKDIQGKYHEFATILRQHNVSGRENAFDKLINLFLCKITDEEENKNELKFYWKGKAYDNPFDFQDRLQELYKIGMEKFLNDTITYVADSEIDKAFGIFRDKPNIAKDQIKEFVRQLKFFSNNDFAFIDVHNEKLFYQNFAVLLKIAQMIQNIKLTESEENQFLGDMFEGFLDQGVKQSEGQFFTPMPIVKFIISSLPQKENPKVIDYACGAGHFLNEYAKVNKNSEIVGIEKEYRLSKVAKVSGFMYGQDIDIIYNDALKAHEKLKNQSFDVLIANPPYSVKGFLTTLHEDERNKFELIKEVDSKSYSKTGSIECFFIERAKQLLKTGAVAGIIVPSSILNKDTPKLYTVTREIILKYFKIIAIAEFGSGTFGKTGTNTVTLFLEKKDEKEALHYRNMINSWFDGEFESNTEYKDNQFLEKYCEYLNMNLNLYKDFLIGKLKEEIFENEIFAEYKKAFLKQYKPPKTQTFKALSKEEKEKIKKIAFLEFIKDIEKEKLYYFCLAFSQKTPCIIVKSPSDNNEAKKFLGYEWSGRKGSEGIQYLSIENNITQDTDELEDDDKRVLKNMFGLQGITTPLYNPQNEDDENKINKIIKDNFKGLKTPIKEDLKAFANRVNLIDLLDFSRVEFNKALNLTPKKLIIIESKYPQAYVKDCFLEINNGKNVQQNDDGGKFRVSRIESIAMGFFDITATKWTNDKVIEKDFLQKGDFLFSHINSVKHLGKTAFFDLDEKIVHGINLLKFRANQSKIMPKYAYIIFNSPDFINEVQRNALKAVNQASVNIGVIERFKIPLPPLEIQEQIIAEIENLENQEKENLEKIEEIKSQTKNLFENLYSKAQSQIRLSDNEHFELGIGKRVLKKEIQENGKFPIYSANVFEPFGFIDKELLQDFSKDSVIWGIDGDWLVSLIEKNIPFYPTDHCGYLRVKKGIIEPKFLAFALEKAGLELRFSRTIRASIDRVGAIKIPLPPLDEQKRIVSEISLKEQEIARLQASLDNIPEKKEAVLTKFL